jgi:hypothetical protein
MRIGLFFALALGSSASTALAKPIELTHAQLDIGLSTIPLWVENLLLREENRYLQERLIELRSLLLPISPGPGSGERNITVASEGQSKTLGGDTKTLGGDTKTLGGDTMTLGGDTKTLGGGMGNVHNGGSRAVSSPRPVGVARR